MPIFANQIGADLEKKDFYFWIEKKLFWLKDYYYSERIQKYIRSQRKTKSYFWTWEYVKKCFWKCKKLFWSKGFANFDDLNVLAVKIIKRDIGNEIVKRFPIIFIDECQDLSANELEVLKQLKEKGCHIHFIGDLNQSIYEFKRVNPDVIAECVKNFEKYYLTKNFRSCKEIVNFSEQLIGQDGGVSQDVESKFKEQALLYIEYDDPEDAVQKYVELLEKLGCKEYNNRILVKQNSLRRKLERATKDKYDTKEPLIVAAQLWKEKSQSQMHTALELAGLQISRWFGGGNIKKNYYCPKEICSVFAWRIYLMSVLNEIEKTEVLMDFSQTYGVWHKIARRKLNSILESQYTVLKEYDENEERELDNIVNGKNFRVSSGNKDVVINDMVCNYVTDIPIMTIHGSKGCTFDTTLVISSENAKSEGGHWKKHWIEGVGEEKRLGYVASTRAKYLLVWGVPRLKNEEKKLIEEYGFKDSEIINYKGEHEATNTFAEKRII